MGFPDAFVFPRIWKVRTNQQLLHHLLVKGPNEIVQAPPDNRRALEIFEEMRVNFEAVEKRNNALLFTSLPPRNSVAMRLVMADIQVGGCIQLWVVEVKTLTGALPLVAA